MKDVKIEKGEKEIFEIELKKGDDIVRWLKDEKEIKL
jgi:hypothetical protein